MCTTIYFDFCIHYRVLAAKSLVSIYHCTVDPLYPFCPPPPPSKGVTYCLRVQLSQRGKAEPSTDSFTKKEAWLGSGNKSPSWLSDSKLQIWF